MSLKVDRDQLTNGDAKMGIAPTPSGGVIKKELGDDLKLGG
jgi:hypothetical protein